MKAILSKYKYEIYFFYALPALGVILGLPAAWVISASTQPSHWGVLQFSFALASLCVFGITYQRVQRLDRPFLMTLWQGKIALFLLELVLAVFYTLLVLEEPNIDDTAWLSISGALNYVILVVVSSWYAVKVSAQRFSRSAAFVAIMLFYGPTFLPALFFPISFGIDAYEIPLLSLTSSVILLLVAVSAVAREGYVGKMRLTLLLVASFSSSFNIWGSLVVPRIGEDNWWKIIAEWQTWYLMLPLTVPRAFYLAGAVGFAYLLYRFLPAIQRQRSQQSLTDAPIILAPGSSMESAAYHQDRKRFDWRVALSLLGVALLLSGFILFTSPW